MHMRSLLRCIALSFFVGACAIGASPARAADERAGWKIGGELDVSSMVAEGLGLSLHTSTPAMPALRLGVFIERKTAPFAGLSPANAGWKLTFPLVVEGVATLTPSQRWPLLVGLRAGWLHFHADKESVVGLAEEDWYGLTPFVGWREELGWGFYVSTWGGITLPIFVGRTQAEIDVAEQDRTFNPFPAQVRAGLALGFEL